jgi:hypothetical protein
MRKLVLLFCFVILVLGCSSPKKASKGNFSGLIEAAEVKVFSTVQLNHKTEKLLNYHHRLIEKGLITASEKTIKGFRRFDIDLTPEGKKIAGGTGIFGKSRSSRWLLGKGLKNVEIDSFTEPSDFLGKKISRAKWKGDIVLLDWVEKGVFLPEKSTQRTGVATFVLFDDGWKLEDYGLDGESLFGAISQLDQEYAPAPPPFEELKPLLDRFLTLSPHLVQMKGISLPISAIKRNRINPPGCEKWIKFSPLVKDKVLRAEETLANRMHGTFLYKFHLATDKAHCLNQENRKWRIAESQEVVKLDSCECHKDMKGDIDGFSLVFEVKFHGIFPWMLNYPDLFDTANDLHKNGGKALFTAKATRKEDGDYEISDIKLNDG